MKTKRNILPAVLAGVLLALSGCATSRHTKEAWEYRVVEGWTGQRENFEKQLNDAGKEGYVVVSSSAKPGIGDMAPSTVVILKRHKP